MKRGAKALIATAALATMFLSACGGGGGSGGGSTGGDSGETQVLKLGHIANPDTAYDNWANEFASQIEEKTEGRYKIEVYPAGQLGVDRELMESLQIGNVDMTIITASDINQFVPDFSVQDLPYLFVSWDHVEAFLASDTATEMYTLTDSVGMTTLAFMPRGFRNVTTNVKPIHGPDDLTNLKIRVAESEIYISTFKALGANAQAMAFAEVFTALQQGTIDAQENTTVSNRDYKFYEVQQYMSKTQHFFAFAAMQMNPDLLNGMSEEDQQIFRETATETALTLGQEQKSDEQAAEDEMVAAGLEVNEIDDPAAFQAKLQGVYDEYFKTHDKKYFDAIQALA